MKSQSARSFARVGCVNAMEVAPVELVLLCCGATDPAWVDAGTTDPGTEQCRCGCAAISNRNNCLVILGIYVALGLHLVLLCVHPFAPCGTYSDFLCSVLRLGLCCDKDLSIHCGILAG